MAEFDGPTPERASPYFWPATEPSNALDAQLAVATYAKQLAPFRPW